MKLFLFIASSLSAFGANYYIATTGSALNNGSITNPWSITYGLSNSVVQPGDTNWIRGGTYGSGSNIFIPNHTGTAANPIIYRSYPGERVIIDGGIDSGIKPYLWFWGLEITCSNARTNLNENRPPGLVMDGAGCRAINMVLFNVGNLGIGSFKTDSAGSEIHGNIIMRTGIYEYGTGPYTLTNTWTRGSGMYLQNKSNSFSVSDNISMDNYTTGMKSYAENGFASDFIFDGNIVIRNQVGIEVEVLNNSITNSTVVNNLGYRNKKMTMGYFNSDSLATHYGGTYSNNYTVAVPDYRDAALWLKRWKTLVVRSNTISTMSPTNEWLPPQSFSAGSGIFVDMWPLTNVVMDYNIDGNAYHGSGEYLHGEAYDPFRWKVYEPQLTFNQWTNIHGFDLNSSYTTNLLTTNTITLRTNKYELGRSHLVVFNWESNNTVTINLSNIGLTNGQRFEVRDVQNYFGTSVLMTNFNAASPNITLPLTLTNVTPSVVVGDSTYIHTASLFNTFVILPLQTTNNIRYLKTLVIR